MNRLRAYRKIEGITQADLAETLGINATLISAMEKGRRDFTGDLTAIGYSNDRYELPQMSEPLHRHRASTAVAAKDRAHELVRLGGEVFGELIAATPNAPRLALHRLDAPTELEQVDDLAVDVRYMLGVEESGPIANLTSTVERAGVCIIPITGLAGVDGISAWVGDVPVIGLSPTVPGDRFRLSLGHEAGHLIFHTKKSTVSEGEANRFASSLMFPAGEFLDAMPEGPPMLRDFVSLKKAWGVSVAALVYRAHEIGIVDDKRYRSLQIQMSKWRRNEPAAMDPAYGNLFGRLVEVNGGPAVVARDLGVNQDHLRLLLSWSHLQLAR